MEATTWPRSQAERGLGRRRLALVRSLLLSPDRSNFDRTTGGAVLRCRPFGGGHRFGPGGVVDAHGEPTEACCNRLVSRFGGPKGRRLGRSLVTSGTICSGTCTFIVAGGDNLAVRRNADAVQGESPVKHFEVSAGFVDFDHSAVVFVQAVFEPSSTTADRSKLCRTSAFAIHGRSASHGTRGGVDEIAEVVVGVGFTVVVEVDQAGDLVFRGRRSVHPEPPIPKFQTAGESFQRISPISRRPSTSQHHHSRCKRRRCRRRQSRIHNAHVRVQGFSKGTKMSSTTKVSSPFSATLAWTMISSG